MRKVAATAVGSPISSESFSNGRLFIPISLGNHYYSSAILRRLLDEFVSKSETSLIFICDRLRVISYQIRGETDIERINFKVNVQLKQLKQALKNLGLDSHVNAIVADWSFLRDDPKFFSLLASLKEIAQNDVEVHRTVVETAMKLIHRFRTANQRDSDDPTNLQITYILEETALSLYMTEIRGFSVEVYRRGMGFIDYLYADRPTELKKLIGCKELTRKFVSIENWLNLTADASQVN